MSDLEPKARGDHDAERAPDSSGQTQEPLQSHTSSLKNNAAGLSSDEHEKPLNGTQPNPFVYSSVPAVPHAGNSLPSGALVNGPASHPTSEVHCVPNKGPVSSSSVLDAAWQPEKDTSPEVLGPPSELQSDAWKNSAGRAVKTPATQPGVTAPLSHSEQNESKLAYTTVSGDAAEQTHISQPLTKRTIKTGSRQGAERSSHYYHAEVMGLDPSGELFLGADRRLETEVTHQRDGKTSAHAERVADSLEKVNNSLNHTDTPCCSGNDVENVVSKGDSLGSPADMKYPVAPLRDLSRITSDSEQRIFSSEQGNDPEHESNCSEKVEQRDPLFFLCTICNVHFKEHNQLSSGDDAFMCRECGSSLVNHITIHQGRKVKGLRNSEPGDGAPTVHCPRCVLGANCPEIFVQHAAPRDNLKHYYFCEECSYISLTQQALEAHLRVTHLNTHQPPNEKSDSNHDAEETDPVQFRCKMGFLTSSDKAVVERFSEQHSEFSECKPKSTLGKTVASSQPWTKKQVNSIQESDDKTVGCSKDTPSLWRIDKHGKLLPQPAEKLDVATDLTCVEEHAANKGREASGSWKQANCAGLSARKLKLDQMFSRGSTSDPAERASLHPPSMPTPLHNTIDSMNGNITAKLSQRLKKQSAVMEVGKEGSFSEDSRNERNLHTQGYFRRRQRFSAEDQSPRTPKQEDDGDEDCSDIEQLVIKEECMEEAAGDESPEFPCASTSDRFDVFPTQVGEHKPCPYCPAVFESGVGLSNHVRGHLHRVGLSYNARHMVSPEQVAMQDHQPRVRRRIPAGTRKMRKGTRF